MAKDKTSTDTDDAKMKAHPDRKLIKACIEYAFTMGAAHHAYKVDPTDGLFVARPDSTRLRLGSKLLAQIAEAKAETFDGIAAKAATVVMMNDANVLDLIGDDEIPAIVSLAADVVRFHKAEGGKRPNAMTDKAFGSVAQ